MGRARRDPRAAAPPPAVELPAVGLPGVREQLRAIAADLAAGLHCLWLMTDGAVESGLADELYRAALDGEPVRIDIPAPAPAAPEPDLVPGEPEPGLVPGEPEPVLPWVYGDELPYLDLPDSGFDLDLGWPTAERPPRIPAPRRTTGARHDPRSLLARLGKELSVGPDEAVAALVEQKSLRRPLVGVRAWTEADAEAGTAEQGRTSGPGPRGAAVARLFRSLSAAVKAAGLPPGERPRLLVVARLRDLPESLPDELRLGSGDSTVHWWWGALGRLDTATAIAPLLDHRPAGARREPDLSARRIRRAVRAETVVEVCGPDLALARRLVLEWDGMQDTLAGALELCLAAEPRPGPGERPRLHRVGALTRPSPELRQAWARDAVVSWEGRLRLHVAAWHPAATGGPAAQQEGVARTGGADRETRTLLTALVSQAQQRVLMPWIEEARQRVATRALGRLNRPAAVVLSEYADRRTAHRDDPPERAFLELQVGELLRAHNDGVLALPQEDARLLRLLVKARNALAHRSVVYDHTLDELCAALSRADLHGEP
ncbi:hypothetical protein [Streptomyces sp. NPDC004267]|uniref:hypothetical protein n=1 Tax=Streptomyces sp. NPDC004267 TaxID=3364694 RepID=UPI0036A3E97A